MRLISGRAFSKFSSETAITLNFDYSVLTFELLQKWQWHHLPVYALINFANHFFLSLSFFSISCMNHVILSIATQTNSMFFLSICIHWLNGKKKKERTQTEFKTDRINSCETKIYYFFLSYFLHYRKLIDVEVIHMLKSNAKLNCY